MRVLPAGFFDDEPDALGGFPGGSGAFLAAQHRDVRPHGPGDAQGGLPAQFHGAGLSEVLRDDRLHDELRAHQGIGDGENQKIDKENTKNNRSDIQRKDTSNTGTIMFWRMLMKFSRSFLYDQMATNTLSLSFSSSSEASMETEMTKLTLNAELILSSFRTVLVISLPSRCAHFMKPSRYIDWRS